MKKALLLQLGVLVLFIFSCKKNSLEHTEKVENQKKDQKELLSFSSVEAYFKALDKLDNMQFDELIKWKNSNTSNSFYDYFSKADKSKDDFDVSEISNLPTSYQIILNKSGEVKIGDTIYVYSKGLKYHIPYLKQDEYKMSDGSYDFGKSGIIKNEYFIKEVIANPESRNRINLSTSQTSDYVYFYEFLYNNDPASKRRYEHKVRTVLDQWSSFSSGCGSGYTFRTGVYVDMQLKYWRPKSLFRPGSWQPAGEQRALGWDLNATTSLRGVSLPCSTLPEEVYTFVLHNYTTPAYVLANYPEYPVQGNTDYSLSIGYVSGNTKSSATNLYWEIDLSGWITQVVIFDSPAHIWTTSGNPLY